MRAVRFPKAGFRHLRQLWYRLRPSRDTSWHAASGTSGNRLRDRSKGSKSQGRTVEMSSLELLQSHMPSPLPPQQT